MGRSYGGLFTLYVLFTRPDIFDTDVAASPSIWWNDRLLLGSQQRFVDSLSEKPVDARLLVTVGSLEETAPPFAPRPRADARSATHGPHRARAHRGTGGARKK